MLTIKNEHTKNTLAIIELTISMIEIISVKQPEPIVNNQPFTLTSLLKPDNIFKIALSIIFILLTVWSMYIINPKATDETMKSVSGIVEKSKKE